MTLCFALGRSVIPVFHALVLRCAPEAENGYRSSRDDKRPGNSGTRPHGEGKHDEPKAKKAVKPLLPHMYRALADNPTTSMR